MNHNSSSTQCPPWGFPPTTIRGKRRLARLTAILLLAILSPWAAFAAGPVVQLLWSVQPGSATTGSAFGQQPTLIAADAAGNPSTIGLASSVMVTVDTIPAGAFNGGPRTVDIGTAAGNGVATFSGLEIDAAGGYTLTATTGNGTNAVFSPTNSISTCQLWLDAADNNALTVTANNNLTLWADKSGTGNNATNITAGSIANSPLTNINTSLSAVAYGNQRVVSFYGTNQLSINLWVITNTTYSIITMTELSPTRTANNDFYMGNTGVPANYQDGSLHIGYNNTTTYKWGQYADDTTYNPAGGVSSLGLLIASHIHGVGTRDMYFNGVRVVGSTGASYLSPAMLTGAIGDANGGFFNGDIAEVVIYRTNLTDIQRVGVENYLANKWLGQLSANALSTSFFVRGVSTPTGLKITQQPADTTAGVNISPSFVVTPTNSAGAGIPGLTVFVSLLNGSGTLNGTLSQVSDGSGNATFGDLNLTVAGQKQLQVNIPGLLTNNSSTFNIIAAAPSQLAIRTQPSSAGTAGVLLGTQPVISVEDTYGNVVSNITDVITVSQVANGNLSGTGANLLQTTAVAGTATFSGLYVTNSGTSQVTFADGTLSLTANSANIAVTPNVPFSMAVLAEPATTAQVGVPFGQQPQVYILDVYGNTVTNGTPVVASAGPTAVLGDAVELTSSGLATYTGLILTNVGTTTLTFTAGSVSANSTAISISPGPATTVIWTTQPGSALAGSPFGQQPVLKTADAGGNITTLGLAATDWVVVHSISGGGLLGNSYTYNIGTSGSNGVITFKNLEIDNPGANNVLSADFLGDNTVPTNTIPNCILWLDAYDSSTLVLSGTNVTQWTDKSGTGNNAVNTGNYPTTNLNSAIPLVAYGGQHAVSFLGNNWFNVDLSSLSGDANGFTVIAVDVGNSSAGNGNNYFFGSDYDGVDATLHMGYRSANTFTFAQYADDLNWAAPAAFTFPAPRLWTGRLDSGGGQTIYLNGVLEASRNAGLPGTIVNGHIGQGNGGHYNGDLAEVLVYNRGLADSERATVEQYLTQKWLANSRSLTAPFSVTSLVSSLAVTPGPTGNVTLTLSGAPGNQYRILSTTNLTQSISLWQGVATNSNLGGTGIWQLNVTNSAVDRFFRAVTP